MKFEILAPDFYRIYVNRLLFSDVDFREKDKIAKYAKSIVFSLKKKYGISLSGFYQMTIYIDEFVGMFLELQKLEDIDFDYVTVDLKVVILLNQEFLLETFNFHQIELLSPIYYDRGKYYVKFSSMNDILPYLEMGEIIYGDMAESIIDESLCIKKRKD